MSDSPSTHHDIHFIPSGRGKARCPADPSYPNGVAFSQPPDLSTCLVHLPYPAPECGIHVVECRLCRSTTAITASGRADDPVSFYMACSDIAPKGSA